MRVNGNEQREHGSKRSALPTAAEPLSGKAESVLFGGRPKILAKQTFPTAGKHLGGLR